MLRIIIVGLFLVTSSYAQNDISQFVTPPAFQDDQITLVYTHTNVQPEYNSVTFPVLPISIPNEPFYGMRIESVIGDSDLLIVSTTGVDYVIGRREIHVIRRIDPHTNAYDDRPVASISFGDIGPLHVVHLDSKLCRIVSDQLSFEIYSDSAMFLSHCNCPNASPAFAYHYQNLLIDAPQKVGPGTERFWTDGYGGSLHARNPAHSGTYEATNITDDSFTITLGVDSGSIISAFPPKQFDFEYLYGENSRPHVWFAGNNITYTLDNIEELRNKGFGVIMPWASLYNGVESGKVTRNEMPIYDEDQFGNRSNYRYEWRDPVAMQQAINAFHDYGFKVIPYFSGYWWSLVTNKNEALDFMRNFQAQYNLDGWYFDNASVEGTNWVDSYEFIKQVRQDIGDDGIIYHHDSVDIWAGLARDMRVFVPIDAYANYTLKGETGALAQQIHDPNDLYLRFYSTGYGMSQAIGAHKLASSNKPSLSRNDLRRATGGNYNGSSRSSPSWTYSNPFDEYYLPAYQQRQAEYLSGNFSPDVSWPVSWWADPENILVQVSSDSAVISWTTDLPSDSNVRHTRTDIYPYDWGFGITDSTMKTEHSIIILDLDSATTYEYAIRSTNGDKVWGYHGSFTTDNGAP